jgi:hypothetical protein
VSDVLSRGLVALVLAVVVGVVLARTGRVPRDLGLALFAAVVAPLGIYAIFGPGAAAIGGLAIGGAFLVGAMVYGLIALLSRLGR